MGSKTSKHKPSPRQSYPDSTIGSGKGKRSRRSRTGEELARRSRTGDELADSSSLGSRKGDESRRSSVSFVPNGKVQSDFAKTNTEEITVHKDDKQHPIKANIPNGTSAQNGQIDHHDGHMDRHNGHIDRHNGHIDRHNGHIDDMDSHVTRLPDTADSITDSTHAINNMGTEYKGGGVLPKSATSQNIFSRIKNNKKANILMLWEATRDESRKKLCQLCDVCFLPSGTVAVSRVETGKTGLQLYSVADGGRAAGVLGEQFLKAPRGICVSRDGTIAVTDWEDRTVKFMDVNGGFLGSWKTNKFRHPGAITVNMQDRYIVPDISRGEAALGLYSSYGKLLRRFGTRSLAWPWYVTVDRRNRILVSERNNSCVTVFDDVGRFLFSFGATENQTDSSGRSSRAQHESTFNAPGGLTVDSQNNILVSDTDNYRTSMFSPDGTFIKTLVTSTFSRPISVDYDDGLVIIANDSDLRLYKTYMEKTSL